MPHTRSRLRKRKTPSTPFKAKKKKKMVAHGSIFDIRSTARTYVIDDKDQKVPLKTAILLNKDNIVLHDPSKLTAIDYLVQDKCKTIPTHVELKSIQYDHLGGLKTATAIDGTILYPHIDTGFIIHLRNKPKTPHKPRKIKNFGKSPFFPDFKSPPKDSIKEMEGKLTPNSHGRWVAKQKKDGHKRKKSQGSIMHGSASEYTTLVSTRTPKRGKHPIANWCHLLSYGNGGPHEAYNLVAASAHMNTLQIPHDNENARLLESYPEVLCQVKVSLIPGTHLADGKLVQTTQIRDFKLTFEYDANERSLPYQCTQYYVKFTFDALVEAHTDAKKIPITQAPKKTPNSQHSNKVPISQYSFSLFYEPKKPLLTKKNPSHVKPKKLVF